MAHELAMSVDFNTLEQRFRVIAAGLKPTVANAALATTIVLASRTVIETLSAPPDAIGVPFLRYQTSHLRQSVPGTTQATIEGDRVTAQYGTNVEYGAVHEFGFLGFVWVKEHMRRNVSGTVSTVREHVRYAIFRARHMFGTIFSRDAKEVLDVRLRRALQYLAASHQVPSVDILGLV